MRPWAIVTILVIGLFSICSIAADRPTIEPTGTMPSISDLEHLQFVLATHPAAPDRSYAELSTIRGLTEKQWRRRC